MKIEELVLEDKLTAETPYTISSIIYNRKNFVRIKYN